LLYSYLFIPNQNGELEPDLAEKWTYFPEKLEWVINLKKVHFHNNRPVTSRDVKYSLDTWIKNERPDLLSSISEITASSDSIIRIRLKQEDPSILHRLWDFEIFSHQKDKIIDNKDQPVGSGPFRFVSRKADQRVTLEANPNYFNGRPAIDGIVFHYQPEREKAWTRLMSGQTDIAQEISPLNYKMMHQYGDRFYFDAYTMRYYTILLYNTKAPLFSNPNVRTALTMGINRKHIVDHILKGYGRIATGPMGFGSPYQNPSVIPIPFNPDKALALLKQAGWRKDDSGRLHRDGSPFEFTIYIYKENQIDKKIARLIQLNLNRLGIKVHLQAFAHQNIAASYFQNTRFQAVLTELDGAYRNPDAIKRIWSYGSHGRPYAGSFNHPKINQLVAEAFKTKDHAKQTRLMKELDQLIATLQPGTFLFHKTTIDVMSRRFKLQSQFSLTIEGISRFKTAHLDEAFAR
jgi:peptide/nickel transport system substrate-binding protein